MTSKKILFAEHEPVISEIIAPILRGKGYEVSVASDAGSLTRMLSENHPDLIVIDANLSQTDGLQICKMLKADFITSYIPIIILTEKKQIRTRMLEIEHGIDDYLIKPPDPIDLEIRIEMALRRTEHNVRANALTKLPGTREIERLAKERIDKGVFSFAYIDIDNFKYYNDAYGYLKGDGVITQLAHIISTIVKQFGNKDDFLGHIGGDDFVVISTPDREEIIASKIISEFDRLSFYHYNREDRLNKFLIRKDRSGVVRKIPLMSISIAIANNENRAVHNVIELSEIVFEIKQYLKTLPGSNFLVNRRSSKQTLQQTRVAFHAAVDTPRQLGQKTEHFEPVPIKPLGQLLIEHGLISEDQLNEALRRHWLTTQRLGQIVVNMGLTASENVQKMLVVQQKNLRPINPAVIT